MKNDGIFSANHKKQYQNALLAANDGKRRYWNVSLFGHLPSVTASKNV